MSQLSHVENHRRSWNGIRRGRGGNVRAMSACGENKLLFMKQQWLFVYYFFYNASSLKQWSTNMSMDVPRKSLQLLDIFFHKIGRTDVLFPPLWCLYVFHSDMIFGDILCALLHNYIRYQHISEPEFSERIIGITCQNPNPHLLMKRKV
jgi:hypothetical protein